MSALAGWIVFTSVSLLLAMGLWIFPGVKDVRGKAPVGNSLRIDVPGQFASLHPLDGLNTASTIVFPFLFDYLIEPGTADDPMEPLLAVSWRYDEASFTWTLRLREDARFHDGHPLTARDVQHSLLRWLREDRPALFRTVEHITAIGDHTIEIVLTGNHPDFLRRISNFEIFPERPAGSSDFYEMPIGSGPYRFDYRRGEKVVSLVANERYHGKRPKIDRIVFQCEYDVERSWKRLLEGKTDTVSRLPIRDSDTVRKFDDLVYFSASRSIQQTVLLYNTQDPLFADHRIRMACSMAVNKDFIVQNLLKWAEKVLPDTMRKETPVWHAGLKHIPYDPRGALDILRSCGWTMGEKGYLEKDGEPLNFTLLVPAEDHSLRQTITYLMLAFNEIGIKVDLEYVTGVELSRRCRFNADFQCALIGLNERRHNPELLVDLWSPLNGKGKARMGCFEDSRVTDLLRAALSEPDPERKQALFDAADDLIASLHPGTFLFHKIFIDAVSRRIELPAPFTFSIPGLFRLREASVRK